MDGVILVDDPKHVRVAVVAKLEAELESHPEVRQDAVAPVAGAKKDLRGSITLLVAVFCGRACTSCHNGDHLIVVEFRLPFLLVDRAAAVDGDSSGARHLSIVMLGGLWGSWGIRGGELGAF